MTPQTNEDRGAAVLPSNTNTNKKDDKTEEVVDLYAPFTVDTLLEIRMGKMKPMPGLTIESGIDKTLCPPGKPVRVTKMGIVGDEHDPTFHGGVDKAVHGYCSSHYQTWAKEHPSAASRFVPGGFGENLVTKHMNERNLCIGDIVAVGPPSSSNNTPENIIDLKSQLSKLSISDSPEEDPNSALPVLLQISLPRQPCFKLNHRFSLKNFAPLTTKSSRTGWYYRVLRPGFIRQGDQITLVSRPHPDWTIERVQEYLHRNPNDAEANEALAQIEALGAESRDQFKKRVAKQKSKAAKEARKEPKWREFRVTERIQQTPRITSFTLTAVEPIVSDNYKEDIKLKPGAHAKLKLPLASNPNGKDGLVRAYSLLSGDRNQFQLGISYDSATSRGGSRYMHEHVSVGSTLQVGSDITSAVAVAGAASHHIFVAAGVGITAFLALIEFYKSINFSTTLHYAVRSSDEIPFRDRLDRLTKHDRDEKKGGEKAPVEVVIYDKTAGQRLDIRSIVQGMKWNSQLYFCGPKRLMEEAARVTKAQGVPEGEVHFEAFEADVSGDPFEVEVLQSSSKDGSDCKGSKILQVGEDETLLEVLQTHFEDAVGSSCSVGNCGTCRVGLKQGRVDHRGTALTEEEKSTSMLSCVSRGIGRITIEI